MEKRIYFKNLNGLRFIAATLVIFHHIEQYKFWAKLPNLWGNTTIDALGHKAVSFFFVLSGFLITYLLLEEKKQTSDINVRNFYIRRILRIWPLYYLIVLVCLFVVPVVFDLTVMGVDLYNKNFPLVTALLLLVLPNVVRLFSPAVVGGNQLWSIGVEEQFYLVWPLLARLFMGSMMIFLFAFIGLKLVSTVGLEYLAYGYDILLLKKLHRFWVLLQVEQMAIGAIGACVLFYNKERILKIIYSKPVFYGTVFLMALLFVVPVHGWWINYAEAVLFVVFIMNLSTNPAIRFNMENKVMSTLGNISYGIYMYHTLCITVCFYLLRSTGLAGVSWTTFNVLLYTLSVVLTIIVSYYSYELFEKKFLVLKERFMIVKSGDKAQPGEPSTDVTSATLSGTIMSPAPEVVRAENTKRL